MGKSLRGMPVCACMVLSPTCPQLEAGLSYRKATVKYHYNAMIFISYKLIFLSEYYLLGNLMLYCWVKYDIMLKNKRNSYRASSFPGGWHRGYLESTYVAAGVRLLQTLVPYQGAVMRGSGRVRATCTSCVAWRARSLSYVFSRRCMEMPWTVHCAARWTASPMWTQRPWRSMVTST